MEIDKIEIGKIYYVQSSYDCKSVFRVKVDEIVDDRTVLVTGLAKSKKKNKKNQEPKPFKLSISALHTTAKKANGGYKVHH